MGGVPGISGQKNQSSKLHMFTEGVFCFMLVLDWASVLHLN